jgi:hypothetical protein
MGHIASLESHTELDVAVISQPLNQRPDIEQVLPALVAQCVRAGGTVYAAVLDPFGESEYRNDRLRKLFEEAGLEAFELIPIETYGDAAGESGRLYVARGLKVAVDDWHTVDGDTTSETMADAN